MRRGSAVLAALALAAVSACSLVVSTSDLAGGAAVPPDGSPPDAIAATDGARGLSVSSCRDLHARLPDAGSGAYELTLADGGTVKADCDMESFDGGWTRVTQAMIVEEKAVQDYAPGSPAHVDVAHTTDPRGGISFSVKVTAVNCNNNKPGTVGPGHYFLVAELDGWTQIMATYGFLDSSACWDIFGHANAYARDANVQEFNPGLDLIGPQMNMARSMGGAALPYDGRTTACDDAPDNFWSKSYANAPKSARVVLRRFAQEKPAGLSIGSDCGLPSWKISDIHVR